MGTYAPRINFTSKRKQSSRKLSRRTNPSRRISTTLAEMNHTEWYQVGAQSAGEGGHISLPESSALRIPPSGMARFVMDGYAKPRHEGSGILPRYLLGNFRHTLTKLPDRRLMSLQVY